MSKVISFINRKGGTAKTTSAINVACVFKSMGFGVTLIETDNNFTLGELRDMELRDKETMGDNFPDLLNTEQENAGALIEALRMNMVDMIIVDGLSNIREEAARSIAENSDIVVVPTNLTEQELIVTEKSISDMRPALKLNPDLKMVLLANRIHFLTAPETIERSLKRLGVPVLGVYLPYFKLYQNLSTITAAGSYREVTKLLLKLLSVSSKSKEQVARSK